MNEGSNDNTGMAEEAMAAEADAAETAAADPVALLEAENAEAAFDVMEKHGDEVEIIITDVVMPGMNGPAMIEEMVKRYPDIKVIFISGYAEDAFVQSFGAERTFNFLPKPYTLKQLAKKVKEVVGGE